MFMCSVEINLLLGWQRDKFSLFYNTGKTLYSYLDLKGGMYHFLTPEGIV